MFEPIGTHAATEAPQTIPASIFESSTHHIMTLGERARTLGVARAGPNPAVEFGAGMNTNFSYAVPGSC